MTLTMIITLVTSFISVIYALWLLAICGKGLWYLTKGDTPLSYLSDSATCFFALSELSRQILFVTFILQMATPFSSHVSLLISVTFIIAAYLAIRLKRISKSRGIKGARALYRHPAEAMAICDLADIDKPAAEALANQARRVMAERMINAD
jgi:hypothetical protein